MMGPWRVGIRDSGGRVADGDSDRLHGLLQYRHRDSPVGALAEMALGYPGHIVTDEHTGMGDAALARTERNPRRPGRATRPDRDHQHGCRVLIAFVLGDDQARARSMGIARLRDRPDLAAARVINGRRHPPASPLPLRREWRPRLRSLPAVPA